MFNGHDQNIAIVCGRPSNNLLVLDCDDAVTFHEVGARLAALGAETWTVQRPPSGSPHDGGGHYWLRTPQAVRSFKKNGLEVRGQGCYVLAPPSVHPGGGLYAFTQQPATIFTLSDLDALLPWLRLEPAPPSRNIPRLARRLLRGDPEAMNRYESRSEAEAAICAALVNAGFEFSDALRLFRSHSGPGKFRERYAEDPADATRYLALTWHSAQEFVQANPSEATRLAQDLRRWAMSRPWPGRTGSTDRAVYLAHLAIVKKCGRETYAASVRELAELAGVSARTAGKATRRLIKAGVLALVQEATPTLAARYRVVADVAPDDAKVHTTLTPHVRECEVMYISHDAFRWAGLGKSGAEVWEKLQTEEEATEKGLAEMTGRCKTTVRRRLVQMFSLGLVEPLGDGWWKAVPSVDLDELAGLLGTAGKGEHERQKHARQRALHWIALHRFE